MERDLWKHVTLEVGKHGRGGRVRVHGNALATAADGTVLVASLFGRQAQLRAITAALRGNNKLELSASFETPRYNLARCEAGYHAYRVSLGYGYWHVLLVAKVTGLILALSEESLWRELRSDRFTTPILRRWVPWLMARLVEAGGLAKLTVDGCKAGLLVADDDMLD
jgi:hypothetical protein